MGIWFEKLVTALASVIWGPIMIALLLGVGLYYTVRTQFLPVRHFRLIWQKTMGGLLKGHRQKSEHGITPFQAVSTALASTVGTGNIVGVAAALMTGGPGAIFWMWVSALLGMATKYAEVVLAQTYREKDRKTGYVGGPMYVIRNGLNSPVLAGLFALLCMLASLGVGNMIQAGAISQAVTSLTPVPASLVGVVVMGLTGVVILGGTRVIARVTEKLVPLMAALYIGGTLLILIIHWQRVIPSLLLIFKEAFRLTPMAAGAGGYLLTRSLKVGLARGVFSNEAGLGSAAIAHAAADVKHPSEQGFWGAMEVFLDTIVICTLTALAILASGVFSRWQMLTQSGILPAVGPGIGSLTAGTPEAGESAPLALQAFTGSLGQAGGIVLGVCTVLFALATIMGWCFYGECCCRFLFRKNEKIALALYRVLYILVIYLGATLNLNLLWGLSDVLNGLMAFPNLVALFLLSGTVIKVTKQYFHPGGEKQGRQLTR